MNFSLKTTRFRPVLEKSSFKKGGLRGDFLVQMLKYNLHFTEFEFGFWRWKQPI